MSGHPVNVDVCFLHDRPDCAECAPKPPCLKCRERTARGEGHYAPPFCGRCVDMCHEALEFDHCCVICAAPDEARYYGFPSWRETP